MRLGKHKNHQIIKSNLKIEFAHQDISSFSGLELICRYFRLIRLNEQIRRSFRERKGISGDYSVVDCILVLMALWFTGGSRLRHVAYICEDPLVKRLCGLNTLPSDRTLSNWLGQFTNDTLQALVSLNSEIVMKKLEQLDLATITLDFDGTVLSCGNKVAWAFRGYNPHNRHAKSYYPLLCHVAQTGHFLQIKNRPGNIHDSKGGALEVFKDCINEVRRRLPGVRIEVRMDGAFFSEPIIKYLDRESIDYVVKVPMWHFLKLKERIQNRKRWNHATKRLAWFKDIVDLTRWNYKVQLLFFREKISDNPKGHQLDLFTPDDGIYEYSVLLTNKNMAPKNVCDFYNGRCAMERQIGELKGEFALETIPTWHYQGNSAYQNISVLSYNLIRNFQIDCTQPPLRKRNSKRTTLFVLESLKSLRFKWITVAGRIVNKSGTKTLRINKTPILKTEYDNMESNLELLEAA